jgi:hypothetical protein
MVRFDRKFIDVDQLDKLFVEVFCGTKTIGRIRDSVGSDPSESDFDGTDPY